MLVLIWVNTSNEFKWSFQKRFRTSTFSLKCLKLQAVEQVNLLRRLIGKWQQTAACTEKSSLHAASATLVYQGYLERMKAPKRSSRRSLRAKQAYTGYLERTKASRCSLRRRLSLRPGFGKCNGKKPATRRAKKCRTAPGQVQKSCHLCSNTCNSFCGLQARSDREELLPEPHRHASMPWHHQQPHESSRESKLACTNYQIQFSLFWAIWLAARSPRLRKV